MERNKYQQCLTPFITPRPNTVGLFIGGLNRITDHTGLRKYFENFGPVRCAGVRMDDDGKSRGFGIVYFANLVSVNIVLAAPRGSHWLHGKQIDPQILLPRQHYLASILRRQVMVHPVDPTKGIQSIRELKEYFGKFGHVRKAHTPVNRETKEYQGYGELVFEDAKTADIILEIGLHEISPGKWVRCYPPNFGANGEAICENPKSLGSNDQEQVKSSGSTITTPPKPVSSLFTSNLNSSPIPTIVAGTCTQGCPGGHVDPDRDQKPESESESDPVLKLQAKSTSVPLPAAVAVKSKSNSNYYGRRYTPPYVVPRNETSAANGNSNRFCVAEVNQQIQKQHWEQIPKMANNFHQRTISHNIDFSKDYSCSNYNYNYGYQMRKFKD